MPRSNDSLLDVTLPFATEHQIHQEWRRSTSAGRHTPGQDNEDYNYATVAAETQASHAASVGGPTSIAPSSIENVSSKLMGLLRKHRNLLWVLFSVFQLGIIFMTTAIVLGAATAHNRGPGSAKVAVVVLVVWGFVLVIGSAAGGWTVWEGRKQRARLEKEWAIEEEIKEKQRIREKAKEEFMRSRIKERHRSLSGNRARRSTSHGRSITGVGDKYPERRPSFQAMAPAGNTPAPSQYPYDNEDATMPPLPIPVDAIGDTGPGGRRSSTMTHFFDDKISDQDPNEDGAELLHQARQQNNGLMGEIETTVFPRGNHQTQQRNPNMLLATAVNPDSDSTAIASDPFKSSTTLLRYSRSFPNLPLAQGLSYAAPTLDHKPRIPHQGATTAAGDPEQVMRILDSYSSPDLEPRPKSESETSSDKNFLAAQETPSNADSLDAEMREITKAKSAEKVGYWDPDLRRTPTIDAVMAGEALDSGHEVERDTLVNEEWKEVEGQTGNLVDVRKFQRRLTGLQDMRAKRRSRGIGGWSEGEMEAEAENLNVADRLEKFRSKLRKVRRESLEQGGELESGSGIRQVGMQEDY